MAKPKPAPTLTHTQILCYASRCLESELDRHRDKVSSDRVSLIDSILQMTNEEVREIVRFTDLMSQPDTKQLCLDFADQVSKRNTGLPLAELSAFCDTLVGIKTP